MASKNELAVSGDQPGLALVNDQMEGLKQLMRHSLKSGLDYGVIPGTKGRPSLLQPGAEKIALMLGLRLEHEITITQLEGGHREVMVTSRAVMRKTGEPIGDGIGICTTMESKYRYRKDWDHKVNGRPGIIENRDVADLWNTVTKMAEKRADVDCVKRVAGASEFFTQDVEDMPDYMTDSRPTAPTQSAPAVAPVVDLQPIRDRIRPWSAANGTSLTDGAKRICAKYGVSHMEELSQAQVTDAVKAMDAGIAKATDAAAETTPEASEPDDVDPVTGEIVDADVELYGEDVTF